MRNCHRNGVGLSRRAESRREYWLKQQATSVSQLWYPRHPALHQAHISESIWRERACGLRVDREDGLLHSITVWSMKYCFFITIERWTFLRCHTCQRADAVRGNRGSPKLDFGTILRHQTELTAIWNGKARQFVLPPLDGSKARLWGSISPRATCVWKHRGWFILKTSAHVVWFRLLVRRVPRSTLRVCIYYNSGVPSFIAKVEQIGDGARPAITVILGVSDIRVLSRTI